MNLNKDYICIFNLENGSTKRERPGRFEIDGVQFNGTATIRVVEEKPLDDGQLNAIMKGEKCADGILSESIFHYIESQKYNLDINIRGFNLYKSLEEIKKVQKNLKVSKELIGQISRTLNKARHVEGKQRDPGDFTQKD